MWKKVRPFGRRRCGTYLVVIFPCGVGQQMKRCAHVFDKDFLKNTTELHCCIFLQGDTVHIMFHMVLRVLTYETDIMIRRSNSGGVSLAEGLAQMTTQDIGSAS